MNCPACQRALTNLDAGNGVFVDVCEGGCGGVWFDNFELQKFDEVHEAPDSPLLQVKPSGADAPKAAPTPGEEPGAVRPLNRPAPAAASDKRPCPRCETIKMRRFFHNAARTVEIEQCANCGGHWLDHGELEKIRTATSGVRETDFDRARAEDKLARLSQFLDDRRRV